jgi:putative SOS response-associated peptidase YedK
MCGRFQLKSDKKTKALARSLQVSGALHYADDIAPGAQISIIGKESVIKTATWWLLLDSLSHKPNYKYASFNSRSDKLDQVGSLAYKPFRESRCIIPASAFVEGMGDKKTYTRLSCQIKRLPLVVYIKNT